MTLTRDEILSAVAERRTETEPLDVPEWGGEVRIRLLSPADLDSAGFFSGNNPSTLPTRILVLALCDEQAQPLFTKKDMAAMTEADFKTTIRVFEVAAKFNGLNDEDVEKAARDFVAAQAAATSSD